jgi:hypothetical protein
VHSVMVVTEAFEPIARATFASRGRADHPLVVLPSSTALAGRDELERAAAVVLGTAFG